MTTATTALLAAAGLPHVEALLPHCRHQRTSLYCALHHDQVPLWLLEAFAGWYEKNRPLAPEERDLLFRRLLYDLWPKPPVEPGSRRGRKQPPRGSFTTHAKNSLAASPAGLKGRTPTPTPTQTASAAAIRGTAPPGDGSAGRRDYVGGGANAAAGVISSESEGRSLESGGQTDFATARNIPLADGELADHAAGQVNLSTARAPEVPSSALRGVRGGESRLAAPQFFSPADLADLSVAGAEWKRLIRAGAGRAERTAFLAACGACGWYPRAGLDASRRTGAIRRLNAAAAIRIRVIAPDRAIQARNERVADYLAGILARVAKDSHSKGAYSERDWSDRRPGLHALLAVPEHAARVAELCGGRRLGLPSLERILRGEYGRMDALERASNYVQLTTGLRADWAGEIVYLDATGLPVNVERSLSIARGSDSRARPKRWIYGCQDLASSRMWLHDERDVSTRPAAWNAALWSHLFALGHAPEIAIMDRESGVFAQLDHLDPDRPAPLIDAVLLWVAAGVEIHTHTPNRPQAGAPIERGFRTAKNELKRILVRDALARELRTGQAAHYRRLSTEHEWARARAEWEAALDARPLRQSGLTRAEAWALPQFAVKREARALVPDARERAMEIIAGHRVMSVCGGTVRAKRDGKTIRAELTDPAARRLENCAALVIPSGMRVGDDPDLFRVLVVEPRQGLNKYHRLEARAVRADILGQDLRQPTRGEHPISRLQSPRDAAAARWDRAAASYRAGISGVREATNDAPLEDTALRPE